MVLDTLLFGSVLVMTDDNYAKNFGVAWCDPRGCAEDRLPPSHKIRQETNSETSLYDTQKVHSGGASIWKTCTVAATTTT